VSAMPAGRSEQSVLARDQEPERPATARLDGSDHVGVAGSPVVVRRNAGVAVLVGGAASAVAIAYLWRAAQTMAPLDWALFVAMGLIAAVHLVALVDAKTPLLVADDLGVRIRLGDEWRGLPWEAVGQVVVHPRRGALRDGRLVFSPHSLARALDGVEGKARRQVVLNQKMYGAPLAVPLGATTRLSTSRKSNVADEIAALALGRAEVVELDPQTLEVVDREARRRARSTQPEDGPTREALKPEGDVPGASVDAVDAGAVPAARADVPTEDAPAGQVRREVFPRVHDESVWDTPGSAPGGDEGLAGGLREPGSTGTESHTGPEAVDVPAPRPQLRAMLGGIGTIVSRVAKGRSHDVDSPGAASDAAASTGEHAESPAAPPVGSAAPAALRETRPGLRAEATIDLPTPGGLAVDPAADEAAAATDGRELRRPGNVDLVFERVDVDERVRPISTLGDPVEPLVIDDYATEPAYDPVIGPELTAARTRLGLSVDDLAERTRIRPHVIESIEVDDFAPCGGDFYARGHLRTLARILGKDPEPLLRMFEEKYATAPINARRVFEAELATGMTGSMRATVGGPSWTLLLGVALTLILVWGVLRLFTTDPAEVPTPLIHGAAVVGTAPAGVPAAVSDPGSLTLLV
jgi:hypothetical protein